MFSIAEPGRVWQWTAELVMPPPYRPRPPVECDCRVPARLKIEQHLFWFVCCFEVNSRVRIRGLKVSGKLLFFWFFIEVSLWRLCHIKLSIKRCFSCFLDGLTLLTLHSSNIFSLHLAGGDTKKDVASPRQLTEEMESFPADSWPWSRRGGGTSELRRPAPWSSSATQDTISRQYLTDVSNWLTV